MTDVEWMRWREYREAAADWAAEQRTRAIARNTAPLGAIDRIRGRVVVASIARNTARSRGIHPIEPRPPSPRPVMSCGPWSR